MPGPYRNAPPASAMFQRPIRTPVPSLNNTCPKENKKLKLEGRSDSGHSLKKLSINSDVRLHDGEKWSIRGKVVEILNDPRSYVVLTSYGKRLRRNRKHILLIPDNTRNDSNAKDSDDRYSFADSDEFPRNLEPLNTPDEMVIDNENDSAVDDSILVNPENDTLSNESMNVNEHPVGVTRSGRFVIRPRYLKDYQS